MDDLSVCASARRSVRRSGCPVHCGKTADRIPMPFGVIGQTHPGIRQIVRFGDRSMRMGTSGENLGRTIVTNGDFTAYVCDSAAMRPSSQITLGKLVSLCQYPAVVVCNFREESGSEQSCVFCQS